MRRWFEQTFAAFAIPQYRLLWIGTLTSFLGFFMSTVVNSVVAFELTGTNRAVGSVIFAQGLSMFLFGPIGGAFADRWPKRRVIATGQVATVAVFVVTALLVAAEAVRLWHLAAGTFVLGVCFSFMGPARQAFVVDLVPPERRGNAMALSQIANNASRIGGPAIAGVLLAWKTSGASGAYAAMAGLYGLSALSLAWLPRSFGREDVKTHVLADVAAGLRYVRDDSRLRILVLLFVAVVMTGFPYVAVMPGIVENELGRSADAISLLFGVAAVGGLLSSVLVARYADSSRARSIYSGLGFLFGLTLFSLAAAPSYAAATVACFAIGVANGGFQTLSSAVVIHATEPEYMGRVMSLTMLAFAGFGLMGLPIGALADALGERAALVAMGTVVCLIVLVSWAAFVRVESRAGTACAER